METQRQAGWPTRPEPSPVTARGTPTSDDDALDLHGVQDAEPVIMRAPDDADLAQETGPPTKGKTLIGAASAGDLGHVIGVPAPDPL